MTSQLEIVEGFSINGRDMLKRAYSNLWVGPQKYVLSDPRIEFLQATSQEEQIDFEINRNDFQIEFTPTSSTRFETPVWHPRNVLRQATDCLSVVSRLWVDPVPVLES